MRTTTVRRAAAAATASAAALSLALLTAGPATAAPAPGFLKPADLPPHSSSAWFAGKVTKGLPDPETFCFEGAVPDRAGTYHRDYRTDYDTGASQVTVTLASAKAADRLAARLEARAANCAADWLRDNPGSTASWDDYGTVSAGDRAHVYGVHTAPPESEHGVNLLGVAREGATVTLVRWAEMGTLPQAPVTAFRTTVSTAVDRL
ncbi:hypothetical protein [Streptomyces iconiensis]|uniref:PknH-like extracellular domain-containing protein n=1 Tax=Streptomyces iconiensis TaxID=1384038 RepID=A0ABT7A959_9ACTN|nr:hypothetical protein [Streptomyces iconiensis]MDJ1137887.1 hypothetical protein [Streptomyces iconiensis]